MYKETYLNKKVLITGNTGFKGSWLTVWLLKLGANVIGYSNGTPTNPSMFEILEITKEIKHYTGDICDISSLEKVILDEKPDFIFHLAAQAIVSVSYTNPSETVLTNAIGTLNLLEVLRKYKNECNVIMITSDKCYDNVEWIWGYRETDALGGKDVYSGSKAAAELIIKSYQNSFFLNYQHPVKICVARAGNVIGGGDWAKDRIIVDCIKSWENEEPVEIRSPDATRPWQHVLEPLSGYLLLGQHLAENNRSIIGDSFNFGPKAEQNRTVVDLLSDLFPYIKKEREFDSHIITDNIPFHEASLLKLNCDKALSFLNWESTLDYYETVDLIGKWYVIYFEKNIKMFSYTLSQIENYESLAKNRNKIWTK
jgi:CDP-glucose 4,6-dehydratase